MGRYTNQRQLSKKDQEDLFVRFAVALASIRSSVEAAHFIKDLLSEAEAIMLARRLQIVDLLEDGLTYAQIRKALKVSTGTIAKMQAWLNLYGENFRKILKRTHKKQKNADTHSLWAQHKRKYSMYYWPELLLRGIVETANRREKEKLRSILKQLPEKTKLTKELTLLLKSA